MLWVCNGIRLFQLWNILKCTKLSQFQCSRLGKTLQLRHNEHDGVSNHQPHDCLLNRLFRRRSKKTSKFRIGVLCEGNSPVTGEFPSQRASNAENVFIWWRHLEWFGWSPVLCETITNTNADLSSFELLGTNYSNIWIQIQFSFTKCTWKCHITESEMCFSYHRYDMAIILMNSTFKM